MINTVYGVFKETAEKYADCTAIQDREKKLTYQQLNSLVSQISRVLTGPHKRIGMVMDHGILQIASMLAVLKMGDAYVPAEPFLPDQRVAYMFEESGVRTVLCSQKYEERINKMGFEPLVINEKTGGQCKEADAASLAVPEDPAYILYTSGSTGKPKGVMVLNRNITHYVRAFQHEFHPGPEDAMLQYSVCSFDIFTEEVFTTLLSGAALIIPDPKIRDDFAALMKFIAKEKVTEVSGFPYLIQKMNDLDALPSSLRLLISGGDVLRASYIDRLIRMENAPMIYNTYGPSETTVCASYFRCLPDTELEDGTYPIGRPVLETDIEIVKSDGTPAKPGETGEIVISGEGVSAGYCGNRPKESRAFFQKKDGTRCYHSGDLGYILPDGNLAFIAREDDQVMIDGRRVEPGEVESVLSSNQNVYQVSVRPFKDDCGLSFLTAYIVFKDPKEKISELRKYASEYLADYMIPEFFIRMDHLPLTENGKVDFRHLPVVLKEGKYGH